jgi:hypothetical protein
MATYTVRDRGRHEATGRPYSFAGRLEVVHTRRGRSGTEQVSVYRRDDGRRVVEFSKRALGRDDLGVDTYAVVSPEDLPRAIVAGCAEPQACAVARQLGFEIGEPGRRRPAVEGTG